MLIFYAYCWTITPIYIGYTCDSFFNLYFILCHSSKEGLFFVLSTEIILIS
jgi:hypothetical protein